MRNLKPFGLTNIAAAVEQQRQETLDRWQAMVDAGMIDPDDPKAKAFKAAIETANKGGQGGKTD